MDISHYSGRAIIAGENLEGKPRVVEHPTHTRGSSPNYGAGFPTPPNRLDLLVAPIAFIARYPLRYWRAVVYPVGYAVPCAVLAGLNFFSLTRHRSNLQDCRTMNLGGDSQ